MNQQLNIEDELSQCGLGPKTVKIIMRQMDDHEELWPFYSLAIAHKYGLKHRETICPFCWMRHNQTPWIAFVSSEYIGV